MTGRAGRAGAQARFPSGVSEEFGTISNFLKDAKSDVGTMAEFKASRVRLLALTSTGAIGLKLRGKKKDDVTQEFKDLRRIGIPGGNITYVFGRAVTQAVRELILPWS